MAVDLKVTPNEVKINKSNRWLLISVTCAVENHGARLATRCDAHLAARLLQLKQPPSYKASLRV
jgi:hypothetical protein